jgi:hypothetical protein
MVPIDGASDQEHAVLTGGGGCVGGLKQRVVHGHSGREDVRVEVREAERAAHHQHVPPSRRVARQKVRYQPRRLIRPRPCIYSAPMNPVYVRATPSTVSPDGGCVIRGKAPWRAYE